ncbi:DUF4097 family beta strand repeat-containing protein [Terrihalobacillus insolitus]|uniref:DUF4097 family beta strand repeat-containing protein n=1 Tax=Terrihalobacillus insolitus TaxID=2950438 RepID=UPI002340A60E|nr:DUF4097 domain-containing protein [Terrihalobacillus insolitus]MDC3412258.1 DUF4097 family beta strand repeat-containing protein [Terrihalobacillus insolitus]
MDLDLNFGDYYDVSHVFHSNKATFTTIGIDIFNGDVTLIPWDEKDVRIESQAKVYQSKNQHEAKEKFIRESEFQIVDNILAFTIPSKQIKADLKLYVPRNKYTSTRIKLFNGKIHVNQIESEQLEMKTSNGSIDLSSFRGNILDVESINGSIKLEDVICERVETETIHGSIHVDGTFKKIEAQAVNGSVYCNWQGNHAEMGFFKTIAGSVRLTLPEKVRVDGNLMTKIGSIHFDIDNYAIYQEKREVINHSLHFIANDKMKNSLHVEAETKTGSIWILPSKKEV